MTPYDIAMAVVVVAGMAWGAIRGITWQLASIASLVLGYSVSHPLSGQLAPHFPGQPVVARALAMITVYLGVSGGVYLIAWVVRTTLEKMKFEAFDRHLGMLLGGMEGALLGLVATLFVVSLAPQTRTSIFASPTGRAVGQLMSVLGPVLPTEARQELAPFWSNDQALAVQDATAPAASLTQNKSASDPNSVSGVIEQEESRLGKAIANGAARGIRSAVGGGTDDGTVERR